MCVPVPTRALSGTVPNGYRVYDLGLRQRFAFPEVRIRIRFTLMQIRILLFIFMRILFRLFTLMRNRLRILLFIKVMLICDHWSTDFPGAPFEPPRLLCERHRPSKRLYFERGLKLLNFDIIADPDPAFHSNSDPDPTSNADPDLDLQPLGIYPE
jgi:hypothetical protein